MDRLAGVPRKNAARGETGTCTGQVVTVCPVFERDERQAFVRNVCHGASSVCCFSWGECYPLRRRRETREDLDERVKDLGAPGARAKLKHISKRRRGN